MNDEIFEGRAAGVVGGLEQAAGEATGAEGLRKDGAARTRRGRAKAALGSAEEVLDDVAGKVVDGVSKVRGQAKAAAERVSETARAVGATVDPVVRDQPYVALGAAMALGLLVGLLIAGRGPKIVYVRPPAN